MTQQYVGGMPVVGEPMPTIQPGEIAPGVQGMPNMPQSSPAGAAAFSQFMPHLGGRNRVNKVVAPMERPVMRQHIANTRQYFSGYLEQARGVPLQEHEKVPKLLILIQALFYSPSPAVKWDLIKCMENTTIPLSTSKEVIIPWAYQEFRAVPYAVTEFPLGVALSIIDHCANTVYDDMNPKLDRSRGPHGKIVMEHLAQEERIVVGPTPFREPTPAEAEAMKTDFGVTLDRNLYVDAGSTNLLLNFGGMTLKAHQQPNAVQKQPEMQAGSMPIQNQGHAVQATPGAPVIPAAAPGAPAPLHPGQ